MNSNCTNCAAAPECPTACDYGSILCAMKRLQSGQTKGRAIGGFSLKDADDLRRYRAIGPPSDLIRPVRCGECKRFRKKGTGEASCTPSDYCFTGEYDSNGYKPHRHISEDDYCSWGERRQSDG